MSDTYTPEEAQAIFKKALQIKQGIDQTLSREDIEKTAAEMGIDAAILKQAIQRHEEEQAGELEMQKERAEAVSGFKWNIASYAVVCPALFIFDFFDGGGINWAYWPLLGWGIGVIFHWLTVYGNLDP